MSRQYDYLVFIGRFQPFHNGHKTVVDKALELSDNVIIVLGSYNQPRSFRNPWHHIERREMILDCYEKEDKERLHFVYQEDYTYNIDKWVASIQGQVNHIVHKVWRAEPINIGLIGHSKDHSSFYLNLFPGWDSVNVEQDIVMDATYIRKEFFHPYVDGLFPSDKISIPKPVVQYMEWWREIQPDEFDWVREEYKHIENYQKQWSHSPYPPIFQTVDAIVVQSGHVLLVQRGAMPGKGQWALPGGFVNQYETIKDAAFRELREETKIKVPEPVLRGSLVDVKVFDDPYRSQRGRTITTAFYIRLRDDQKLPKVTGSDDAVYAKWVPLGELRRNQMYEDHFDMIDDMVKL
jgi:bifunctional NMN adenylyltransferase/nudix hydrolase